ncbi:hypothetical protein ACE1SV_66770 [Streptomyces sp. E-15]
MVFREGFRADDPSERVTLESWVRDNPPGPYISTTRDDQLHWQGKRYRYEINTWRNPDPTGVDVDATLAARPGTNPYTLEKEVAFTRSIAPEAILLVYDYEEDRIGTWDAETERVSWEPGEYSYADAGPGVFGTGEGDSADGMAGLPDGWEASGSVGRPARGRTADAARGADPSAVPARDGAQEESGPGHGLRADTPSASAPARQAEQAPEETDGELVGRGEVETDRWLPFGARPGRQLKGPESFVFVQEGADGRMVVRRPAASGERTDVGYEWALYRGGSPADEVLWLTRRVHLVADGVSADELRDLEHGLAEAVEELLNAPGYRLPALQPDRVAGQVARGPLLRVRVRVTGEEASAHAVVRVRPGLPDRKQPMVQGVWYAGVRPAAFVHEIVHGLGVLDDKADPRVLLTPGGRGVQQLPEAASSLMGTVRGDAAQELVLTQDHLRQIAEVFAPYAHQGATPVGHGPAGVADRDTSAAVDYALVHRKDAPWIVESRPGEILWRFSDREPEEVFRDGFTADDVEYISDLYEWRGANPDAQFIATTRDPELWYRGKRYRYRIDSARNDDPQGIDVNATVARMAENAEAVAAYAASEAEDSGDEEGSEYSEGSVGLNEFPQEEEVAFTRAVSARAVVGVYDRILDRTGTWNDGTKSVRWSPGGRAVQLAPAPEQAADGAPAVDYAILRPEDRHRDHVVEGGSGEESADLAPGLPDGWADDVATTPRTTGAQEEPAATAGSGDPVAATRAETDAPAAASDPDRPNTPVPAGVVDAAVAPVSAGVVEAAVAPAVATAVEDGTAAPDPTTSEAGAATGQGRLSGSVTSFGTGRDGSQGLVHVDPVPEETVHWLRERIFQHVEGDRGEDPAFRRAVRATLTPAYLSSEWARLFSEHGLPLRAPYRGGTYRVSLRFALSEPRRIPAGIEEMPDGPPVGIQRWMFGVSESGSTDSTGDLRAASLSHGHTLPFAHTGWFRRLTFAPQLTFTHNQTTTSVTAGATVQPMVLLRSRERSWPVAYTLHAQLRTTASLGEAVTAPPAAEEWHTSAEAAPDPLTVWFPQHLLDDEPDTAAPAGDDAERLPAPMEVLLGRVPLFATETVPHADRLLADVLRSFGPALDGLSEASLDQLRRFLDEGAVRGNLPLMYGGHHSSPTLYAENGSVIGMLRLHAEVSQRTGEQALAGPATRNGVLESHVLRSVRLSGTTAVTNAAGVGLAVSGGLALGSSDPAGLTLTAQAAVQQQVTDSLTAGGSARTSHSLRTAKPLLRVHADVVWRATLVRPDRPEQQPAEGSPLARGARYPLILRVPSAATVTGAPATPRHLPPELLHLRDLGVSTTPVAVRGTGPLFDELETWLGDHGFLPPRRGRAGSWYHGPVSGAAHLQRLNNQRKLDQLRSDMGLRAAFDEMTAGGHPVRFELPTATGTHRVSFRIAAERRHLTEREDGGVTHDLHLTGVQTLNYSGSTVVGDEQATRVPLALSGTVQASLTNPFDGHGNLWLPGLTPEYAHSRQSSRVTGSSSGTGHEFYALSPTADGVQVHTLPVTYRTSVSFSHGPAMEPREAEGEVTLAVPTYRTLERPAGSEPPAEVRPRPLGPDDAAVPANAVRLPETAWVDRAGGSRELRQAVNEMLAALRGALAEDTAADRSSRTDDVELRSMPGAWPEPVGDDRAADDRPADATAVPDSAAGESRAAAAVPDTAAEASRDTAAEAPGRAGDAAAEHAERDHPAQADSAQAGPASDTATAWAAAAYRRWAANALDGAARAVRLTVGQAAAAVRRVDELATGERPDAPGSVVQEVVEAGLSPHHLVANAYRLFNDRYVIEGAFTSGVLTGTDITIEVEGRLTDVRAMPRPGVMDYERWIQSVDASAETRGTSRSHGLGVTVAADYGGSGRVVAPSGHYAHRRTVTEATTVNDTSAVFRVTSENDVPAHRFAATARYKVTVRAGLRNVVAGTVAAGPRYENTRIVELPPESVEFLLSDHDLVNHPEFRLDGVPKPPAAAPADRALPSWFVGSGGRIGFGSVVEAHADGPDGGRSAFEDTVLRLVEQVAPGATVPGTAAYRPGVRSRINEHASSLGLRTLVNAGPDGHIGFSFVHPSWLGPMRVEVVLRARPAVPLDTVRGRRAAGNPGLDNVLGHTSGDGSSLPEPGSTRQTRSTTTSATADFSPVIQHGGYRFRPTLSASWQAGVADAATSTRDRRAWQRSMMDVSEFELRYRYEATVSARPMDELLPGASLRMLRGGLTGLADAVARRLPEDTRTSLGHLAGRLPLPVRQVSDGVGVRVVLRFNGSETPAESAAPRPLVEPAVLTADPARPLAAPPAGTVIDMEVPAALRALLAAPAWVPRRPFAVYDTDALPQLAEALRAVDPSLGGPACRRPARRRACWSVSPGWPVPAV